MCCLPDYICLYYFMWSNLIHASFLLTLELFHKTIRENPKTNTCCAFFNNFRFFPKGGFDDNSPLSSVERFDPRMHRWEYVSELTTPRGGVGVATVMGRVFAVGGHNGNIYLNTVEAFEPRMNRWGGDEWGLCDIMCLWGIKVGFGIFYFLFFYYCC